MLCIRLSVLHRWRDNMYLVRFLGKFIPMDDGEIFTAIFFDTSFRTQECAGVIWQ